MIDVAILADSLNYGNRLTTFRLRYPRIVHSQLLTHRMFSRNSSSSRAIPATRLIQQVRERPYLPANWGSNQKGMVPGEPVSEEQALLADNCWYKALYSCLDAATELTELGIHKQWVNRLLEPFSFIDTLVTATDWQGFFKLRCAEDAQDEIAQLACRMREALDASTPTNRRYREWHLPFGDNLPEELTLWERVYACSGRCARISYQTHTGETDVGKDIQLGKQLVENGHYSPLEHCATPGESSRYYANFSGWKSARFELGA